MSCRNKKRSAFTLIELIIVLVILAVLVVLVVPQVSNYMATARETAAVHNARAVMNAAEMSAIEKQKNGNSPAGTYTGDSLKDYLQNTEAGDLSYQVVVDSRGVVTGGQVTSKGIQVSVPSLKVSTP